MEGNSQFTTMNPMVAYEKGLTTWAKWIDLNVDPSKTQVIFRSMSPRHNRYSTPLSMLSEPGIQVAGSSRVTRPGQQFIIDLKEFFFGLAGIMDGNAITNNNL